MIILKTEEQLKRIRESSDILSALHSRLSQIVQEGVTTKEIDSYCRDFIERKRARPAFLGYMDYPASTCISINEEVIHGIPGKRKIKAGDIVSIDIGVDLKGYFSDAAQTIIIGEVSDPIRRLVDVTRESLELAIASLGVGVRIHEIGRVVSKHAESHGFSVVREYCGHGVGLSLHEDPQIPNYASLGPNPRLKAGMVIAIEPMINLGRRQIDHLDDGWTVVTSDSLPSAHFEHSIAIHKDHIEVLTAY